MGDEVTHRFLTHLLQVNLATLRNQILSDRRYDDPLRLLRHGFRLYSQSEEDGIIQEIFNRVGIKDKCFVEIAAGSGLQCNTAKLLVEGWCGTWVEADPQKVARMEEHFKSFIAGDMLKCARARITTDNINDLVKANFDLLVIDIDYNDYWIWEALKYNPRVVVIEYNAAYHPPMSVVVPYDEKANWDGTNYHGASLEALVRLGRRKGYTLVGCDLSGSNAFFVLDEYKDLFYSPATAEAHYEPQRAYFSLGTYNPPSPRPLVLVE